jgi:hypothetical protein
VREKMEGAAPVQSISKDGEDDSGAPLVLIRVLEDIPPFTSGKHQYRLMREDVVYMPATFACVLVKNGKAVEIGARPT